ncbi:MAG TPA: HlyD family efflux transporter periplasmic adaptor subunit [Saprospiraceae bacterium]|nr:HlyD family efflux transporter periplasmic adaptor subunit [Saprospiraceae bacterium]HPN68384.1 HlyD family efflux transporter periplasmic adaptor subunit [Saprospiraceae bacterium]
MYNEEVEKKIGRSLESFRHIYRSDKEDKIKYWFIGILAVFIILLFLPWTQNIRSEGVVTSLKQDQRPQEVNNIIPGRILKWYVKEGDFVKQGDTIVQLAEIKDEYLDPQLLERTDDQIVSERMTLDNYRSKISTTLSQMEAMKSERDLKLKSLDNKVLQVVRKVESDSIKLVAVKNEMAVADRQLEGAINMYDQSIIPLTEFEKRKVQHQNVAAKLISAQNDYNNTRQDLLILQIEKNGIVQEYNEKIAKTQGDQFTAQSQVATGQGKIAKLQNQYDNYRIRQGQYFVVAPQDGQIVKAMKAGINEMVKEGAMIVEIVPIEFDKAVEIWVKPMDVQLLSRGQHVRFMFDGFPAIVFTGWPSASFGTFGGIVTAVESNVSVNGMFRVLVAEDPEDRPWPKELRQGGGAVGFALLKNVPIYYEFWRQINGFPPDFYKANNELVNAKK